MHARTRVIVVEELAAEIIRHLAVRQELTKTLDLRRVNKTFNTIISKLVWKAPPVGGLRLFLANVGDYDIVGVSD